MFDWHQKKNLHGSQLYENKQQSAAGLFCFKKWIIFCLFPIHFPISLCPHAESVSFCNMHWNIHLIEMVKGIVRDFC